MKKALLGTSALAGVSLLAVGASAQDPIQLGLGGNFTQALTYKIDGDGGSGTSFSSLSNENPDLNYVNDFNINFAGSTSLENGLDIGVFIQLDNAGGGGDGDIKTDEYGVTIGGAFGRVFLGVEDGALDNMAIGIPDGGSAFGIGDFDTYPVINTGGAGPSSNTSYSFSSNDGVIEYRTPRFAGLMAAISYTPYGEGTSNGANQTSLQRSGSASDTSTLFDHAVSGALNYSNSFGGVSVAAMAGVEYGQSRQDLGADDDPYAYGVAATVGVAGFEIGALFNERHVGSGDNDGTAALGLSYSAGPVGVGTQVHYVYEDNGSGDTDRLTAFSVDGSYALGPGVSVGAILSYGTASEDNSGADDLETFGFGTSISVSF